MFALTAIAFTALPSFKLPPATVVDQHLEVDVDEAYPNPCNGDILDVTGHEIYDVHAVFNKNRANTSTHAQGRYDAVDANGNTYSGHGSYSFPQNLPADNGAATISLVYQVHFVGHGSAPNFTLRIKEKITVNANGEITVSRSNTTVSCN